MREVSDQVNAMREERQDQLNLAAERSAEYLETIEYNLIEVYMKHRCSHPEDDPICVIAANVLSLVWMVRGYMLTQTGAQPLVEVLEAIKGAGE